MSKGRSCPEFAWYKAPPVHGKSTLTLTSRYGCTAQRKLRTAVFLDGVIPGWISPVGYSLFAVLGIVFIPMIYPPVRWYMVLVAYIVAPLMAVPNSYGTGLTDWDECSMYGKLCLFIFAAWAGASVSHWSRGWSTPTVRCSGMLWCATQVAKQYDQPDTSHCVLLVLFCAVGVILCSKSMVCTDPSAHHLEGTGLCLTGCQPHHVSQRRVKALFCVLLT